MEYPERGGDDEKEKDRRFTKIEGIPKEYAVAGEAKYLALYDFASGQVLRMSHTGGCV